MFVSLTRLRLRSPRFLPGFAWVAWRSTAQLRRADGFRRGALLTEPGLGFWTATVWHDEEAMRAYHNADAQGRAMRKLARWRDEASVAHWYTDDEVVLDRNALRTRMIAEGRLSKVRYPSPTHAVGRIETRPLRAPLPIAAS